MEIGLLGWLSYRSSTKTISVQFKTSTATGPNPRPRMPWRSGLLSVLLRDYYPKVCSTFLGPVATTSAPEDPVYFCGPKHLREILCLLGLKVVLKEGLNY